MRSRRLRIVVLGPGSNPKSVTGALIGYRHSEALARLHEVTLVVMGRDEEAIREAEGPFVRIESIETPNTDRFYAWLFRRVFKNNYGNLLWTAAEYPRALAFEWLAWRRLRARILAGEFDVVLRLLPIAPTIASPFAFFLRNGPIPFVIGPLNGGLPWPKGFSQLERQRAEPGGWAAKLRSLYWLLPFAHSTYANAAAIIAGSSNTCREFALYRDKVFYVPGDNGVQLSWIVDRTVSERERKRRLELVVVNRLVPLKAVDLALHGASALLRDGRAHMSIVGDGPERRRLEILVGDLGIREAVSFCGSVSHVEVLSKFMQSDVLLFPSLREFGGGVVFEALAIGVVPVVADFGGPGDIVTDDVGYRIPLTTEKQMTAQIASVLERLASDRTHLETLRRQGATYARDYLSWDAKAQMMTEILWWAVGVGPKPRMAPPRRPSMIGCNEF